MVPDRHAAMLERVRSCYAAFARRDVPAMCALSAPSCLYEAPGLRPFMPWSGVHAGHKGVREFVEGLDAHLVFQEFTLDSAFADVEAATVFTLGQTVCRVRSTGRSYRNHWAHLFQLNAALEITLFREYPDTAAQLAAVHPAFAGNNASA
ncbi:nuclear transport factor 2 family protein [Variovorax saccharolyticus]|uniref:nuclear transport factor 2 family protein n=1 Tax=Variovorax saccharolyticus TaxID=3053516 RepID=UPI002578EB40|nr:nuclear transport factor 2 family protein [Variovorax sp. J31P216]MDM0029946.1 nuclear transport factor 2 family protein [Variovorax sp. J31P216]